MPDVAVEKRLAVLHEAIDSAGIPIHGVSLGPPVRVDFQPQATAQQRTDAAAIVASFDFRPRKPRAIASLIADIEALTNAQRNKLLAAIAADWLRDHPTAARKLGINLDGDEVA